MAALFGLGTPELLLIAAAILLLFGPKRLPQLGKSLGKTVKAIREGVDGKDDEADEESEPAKPKAKPAKDADEEDEA